MLELRPNCECCDRDLPPDAADACICSFECTFCAACAEHVLHGICPNCAGDLVARPIRPAAMLRKYPATGTRNLKVGGCLYQAVLGSTHSRGRGSISFLKKRNKKLLFVGELHYQKFFGSFFQKRLLVFAFLNYRSNSPPLYPS